MSRFAAGVLVSLLGLGLAVGGAQPVWARDATTATVTSSTNPAFAGAPVTFTARVVAAGSGAPTGTVSFKVDGVQQLSPQLLARDGGKAISAGQYHVCALTDAGGVACWGKNATGQLGDTTVIDRSAPVAVPDLSSGVVAVGAGRDHTCALTAAGAVKCWGLNDHGQLGTGDRTNSLVPVSVSGLSTGVTDIAVGEAHSCALVGGGVWCWGLDGGRLGDTTVADRVTPVAIAGLESGVVRISAGFTHTCVVLSTGAAKCWGSNEYYQLGDGLGSGWRLTDVAGLGSGVDLIAAGAYHTCAVTTGGAVLCWGTNGNGRLGIGVGMQDQQTPAGLPALTSDVVAIDAGYAHTCVAMADGTAKCWGHNLDGQLGDGSKTVRYAPVAVSGAADTALVATGRFMTCGMRSTGGVRCWGNDVYGQLGDGGATTDGSVVPIDVTGLTGLLRTAATWTTSGLAIGARAVVAAYPGDAAHDGVTSSALTQTITGKPTTTTLGTSNSPTKAGETVTFTATVSATDGTPTGDVTFTVDGTDRATRTLDSGSIGLDLSDLSVGTHTIGATYGGDATYATSLATPLSQTVERGSSTTGLAADHTSIRAGVSVDLTATVAAVAPSTGSPTGGNVVFRDGTAVLGSSVIAGGTTSYVATSLSVGTHAITAAFQGSTELTASTSAVVTVTVDARSGAEFRANTRTAGSQQYPAVAGLTGGGWVVAWASKDQDGSSWGIYAQRYDIGGAKQGGEFRVNTRTVDSQSYPAIAATVDGGFVVTWLGTASTGKSTGIWAQRWTKAGAKVGVEFRVDSTAGTTQTAPSIAVAPDGGFLISWVSNNASGTTFDVHTQLYDKTAKRVGGEVKANAVTMPAITSASSVAALFDGSWVVTWTSVTKVGAKPVVKAQHLTAKGARTGAEIAVTGATWAQSEPVVASLGSDGWVVVWVSQGQDGGGKGLYAQRYTPAGARRGATFRINLATVGDQSEPSAVTRLRTGFLVTWTSPDGSGKGIYCRLYGANGVPYDTVYRANTTTANDQKQSAVTMVGNAAFVVVWTSASDGGAEGVYGQRFEYLLD